MKSLNSRTLLTAPLLVLCVSVAATGFAAAPDAAGNRTVPRERAETTLPDDRTPSTAGEVRVNDEARAVNPGSQQAQGRTPSQQPAHDTDLTQTPGQQACENSHAPTGSPSIAENQNAQGGNPQANENARGSRAADNQSEQGAANSRAELAQAGDDCLDVNETLREQQEDARGQGTGNNPGDRDAGSQTRGPQS